MKANIDGMAVKNRMGRSGSRDECALGRTLREAHVLSADAPVSAPWYAKVDRGWKGTIVASWGPGARWIRR